MTTPKALIEAFEKLKNFFETKAAARDAAESLKKDVEIGVTIRTDEGETPCAFFKENGEPRFAQREPRKPDVIFTINSEAIEKLVNSPSEDVGEIGVLIVKEVAHGNVKIRVTGSLLNFITRGYLGVIGKGGATFSKHLASKGLGSLGKIKETISNLRNG